MFMDNVCQDEKIKWFHCLGTPNLLKFCYTYKIQTLFINFSSKYSKFETRLRYKLKSL